jgi:hypothetical protein
MNMTQIFFYCGFRDSRRVQWSFCWSMDFMTTIGLEASSAGARSALGSWVHNLLSRGTFDNDERHGSPSRPLKHNIYGNRKGDGPAIRRKRPDPYLDGDSNYVAARTWQERPAGLLFGHPRTDKAKATFQGANSSIHGYALCYLCQWFHAVRRPPSHHN